MAARQTQNKPVSKSSFKKEATSEQVQVWNEPVLSWDNADTEHQSHQLPTILLNLQGTCTVYSVRNSFEITKTMFYLTSIFILFINQP